MMKGEIDRAHVQRGQFRLDPPCRLHPILHAHEWTTTRRDVDDGVGLLLDARQESCERLWRLVGSSGLRIPCMQVEDDAPALPNAVSRLITGRSGASCTPRS